MFVLQPKPTFKAEVKIPIPGGAEGTIKFTFKHKGRKDLKVFFDSLASETNARDDLDALMELVEGWEGVDEKFSRENLDTLLDVYPAAALAIFEAYRKALYEGRSKN